MTDLALYDTMVRAIAECARVDEVKDVRDKAAALQIYHRQARNLEAEREATNVRLRAERRVGELLKDLARSHGGDHKSAKSLSDDRTLIEPSPYGEALERNGISRQSASRFQALADVPVDDFELALAEPDASTESIIARDKLRDAGAPQPMVDDVSLRLWGWLREFERRGYLDADLGALLPGMTQEMATAVLRLAPQIADSLNRLKESENAYSPR